MTLYSNHQVSVLDDRTLHATVPAIFAEGAGPKTSAQYTFISTFQVVSALRDVGFVPVQARQTNVRRTTPGHARHLVRLRLPSADLKLLDVIPEVVLVNSHDGSSAYELRAGLFRPVCTNGLLVSLGDLVSIRVAHRGDVLERVVKGALEIAARLTELHLVVDQMAHRQLPEPARETFAREALELRYGPSELSGYRWVPLLTARREVDLGSDLWRTYNVVQENLLGGGLLRRTETGRLARSRRVTAIREDVRLNARLWQIATRYLAAA